MRGEGFGKNLLCPMAPDTYQLMIRYTGWRLIFVEVVLKQDFAD